MDKPKLPPSPARTTISFAFSFVERALLEGLANRKFGKAEMAQILAFFGPDPPECVYCGSTEIARWDHLVAVKNGGETVLGNMVPACRKCDDSKRDLAFDIWMQGDAPSSPKTRGVANIQEKVDRIHAYAQQFAYLPRPLQSRLSMDEAVKLQEIRNLIAAVRAQCDALIAEHRKRLEYR